MNDDRFLYRVAIRQEDGTYKRYQADVIGWVADKLYAKCAIPDNIIRSVTITDVLIDGENAILEQCSGLVDKNGKLIFEGDVVKTVSGAIGEVIWMNCGFWVNFPAGYCCGVCVTQEIIGNINDDQFREVTKMVEGATNATEIRH